MAAREPLPDIMGEALGRLRLASPEPPAASQPAGPAAPRPKVVHINPGEPERREIFEGPADDGQEEAAGRPGCRLSVEAGPDAEERGGPARLTLRHELDLDPGELWTAILASRLSPRARRDLDELWLALRGRLRELGAVDLDKWTALEAAITAALADLREKGDLSRVLVEAAPD